MNRIASWSIVLATFLQALGAGCGRNPANSPPEEANYGGLAPTAVSHPVVSSPDGTIGYNHTPLLRLIQEPSGYRRAEYADSGGGFWAMNWDGSNRHRVLDYHLEGPTTVANSRTVMFMRRGRIFSMDFSGGNLDSSTLHEYTLASWMYGPKLDPSRTRIVGYRSVIPGSGLYIADISAQTFRHIGEEGWHFPDWSPDGLRLAFAGYEGLASVVMVAKSDGDSAQIVARGFTYVEYPTWSPSGEKIAFIGRVGNGNNQLYVVSGGGANLRQITTEGANVGVAWAPSGEEIVFVRHRFGDWSCLGGNYVNGSLWRVNVATGERHQLTFNYPVECIGAAAAPSSAAQSAHGRPFQ